MKGIVLAGGSGTRLYPITKGVAKSLLPLYDKPIVYYPLSVLMLAGIREILIITTPQDADGFHRLLGDGSQFGVHLQYAVQDKPNGIAQAFIIGKDFIGDDDVCLVLGDNVFHGNGFVNVLREAREKVAKDHDAVVFGYYVNDPERYGVAEIGPDGKCRSIEEKPVAPKSHYAIVGLYFYPNDIIGKAGSVKPSARGELEITSVNQMYLAEGRLSMERLGRGFAWLDTGTHDSLIEAANYIETIQKRQGTYVACLEEIALRNGWVKPSETEFAAMEMRGNEYGKYLMKVIEQEYWKKSIFVTEK